MKQSILALTGLFVPVKNGFSKQWVCTITIGRIPLGWVIVIISLIVKHI